MSLFKFIILGLGAYFAFEHFKGFLDERIVFEIVSSGTLAGL